MSIALAALRPSLRALTGLLCGAALCSLPACRSIPFAEPKLEGEYGAALKAATREAALFNQLETRAFVHVTQLTPALAEAQAEKLSALRGEPPTVAADRKLKARDAVSAPTFFAVVSTPYAQWNDWEQPGSAWRIALGPDYLRVPVKIVRFERPFTVELLTLYPYLNDFHTGYRLEFDGKLDGPAQLQIAGALGKMMFDWSVEP
jgi:hypothetical protein